MGGAEDGKGSTDDGMMDNMQFLIQSLSKLNYEVVAKKLDSTSYGLPQQRERTYFLGIHWPTFFDNEGGARACLHVA